jgi:iron complex outermembrane receptor protein
MALALGITGIASAPARAQDDAAAGDGAGPAAQVAQAEPAARAPITQIESVTTTARKREEPLQEAPVAVTALTGQALAMTHATDLKTLNFPAPNVNFARIGSFSNAVSVFIRGIGNSDNDSTVDPPVAIFVDGVYIPQPENSSLDLFDVEAVEILRGPQGTLFGRNTTAGAVQIRTRRPSGEFGVRGDITVGKYGRIDLKAAIDMPIVEGKVDAKVAVMSANMDGYYVNTVTHSRAGGEEELAIRPTVRFRPNDDITFTLIGEYSRNRSEPTPGINASEANELLCSAWGLCPPARILDQPPHLTKADYTIGQDVDAKIKNETWGITSELLWDVGPGTITWVSNYRKTQSDILLDIDSSEAPMFRTDRVSPHSQESSELRFASTEWDKFDFVAGVFFFHQKFFLHRDTVQRLTPLAAVSHIVGNTQQGHSSFSAFAEGNYHITDSLTLTAGGRWSWERKTFWQEPFAPYPNPGARITPDPASWDNFGPKAGLSYKITDEALAYFTYSRGFKSGGWNGRGGTATTLGPYDPEVVDGFELGLKSDWFDHRLRGNLALFLNDYKNLQRTIIRPLPGGINPQETVTQNAASATIKGIELELTAVPLEGLQLTGNFSYLDAKYSNFCADLDGSSFFASAPTSPCGGTVFNVTSPGSTGPGNYLMDDDFSSIPLQRAPKFQMTLGASYEFAVGNWGSIVLNANYTHVSNLNLSVDGRAKAYRGPVDLLDATVTFKDIEDRYSVSFFMKNITNKLYLNSYTGVAPLLDTYGLSDPQRWGVEVSFKL